ncbi:MAG: hypothetical protein E3K37_14385 [Candidatus Kuenenia sp.]|nr:hypothetical protein [Candidatus Kuenenia hertensis]
MTGKNNQSLESPKHYPYHTQTKPWHRMVANFCIFFLIVTLTMVYFSYTGKPQAGLLEIGVSAFLFCILFHLVMKYFPLISKIITSLLAIGFAVSLVYINYHFLKVEKKDASLEELLVGDLFVDKIRKTFKKEPVSLAVREGVSEQLSVQKDQVSLGIPSLDQLKATLFNPASSPFQSEYVTILSPVLKEGATLLEQPYVREIDSKYIRLGIPDIPPVAGKSARQIYEPPDKNKFLYFSLSPCIKQKNLSPSDHRKIPLPISEGIGIIHEMKPCKPIVENRIPPDSTYIE